MKKVFIIAVIFATLIISPAIAKYETGGVIKNIMSNGITLLIYPEPDANVVAIEVFVRVGAKDEAASIAGIGHLLSGSILSGTEGRAPSKLSKLLAEVGGNFTAVWQWNYMEIRAITIPSMWDETYSLLADSIKQSILDQRAIDYSRETVSKQVIQQETDLYNSAYTALRRIIYKGTPYDRPYLGELSAVKGITQTRLKEFYTKNFTADRIVISIAGNVDPLQVQNRTEIRFGNMKPGRRYSEQKELKSSFGDAFIEKSGASTYVLMGFPAPAVESPEYPAMCVANVILGGYKSSLLFSKFRDEMGLGYEVGSVYPPLNNMGHIAAYIGLDSNRADDETIELVKKTMAEQFDIIKNGSFKEEDVERAKRFLIGSHALKHERTSDRAFNLGWHEVIGLGYQFDFLYDDKINAVKFEDIKNAGVKYFTNPSFVVVKGKN